MAPCLKGSRDFYLVLANSVGMAGLIKAKNTLAMEKGIVLLKSVIILWYNAHCIRAT